MSTKQADTLKDVTGALQVPPTVSARMAAGDRRQQIVGVAMRLFSQRGFRGTTTKEIAQAAGVSEAIIFRHFATKDELYAAILDEKACVAGTIAEMCEPVAEAIERRDDSAVFTGLAYTMLQHHEQDLEFIRLLLYSALEGHELFQMFWERNVRELSVFMRSYIGGRQHDGAFRNVEPLIVARAFTGMIINHSLVNLLFDPQRRLLDLSNEEAAHQFSEILLQGVLNREDPLRERTASRSDEARAVRRGRKYEGTKK